MKTPVSLLERLRQPAPDQAWARFVELYTPLLYYWARRMGLQAQDAADLVQDVLTLLVQKLPEFTYDQHKSFRGWLRTMTLNRWRETQRRHGARHDEPAGVLVDLAEPDGRQALEDAEYRQHLVRRALDLMRADFQPTTWRACWDHVVAGKPAAAVAVELGMSLDAVYAATYRALRRLRRELEGLMD